MQIQKIFSDYYDDERLYSVLMNEAELRCFGAASKALAVFAPGAYQAKEAAKYAYDDYDDYAKVRGKYALKGLFTPGTATYVKKKVEKMAKQGKSKKEIREYLEDVSGGRMLAGLGEVATGGLNGTTGLVAQGVGLADYINNNRAKLKNKRD